MHLEVAPVFEPGGPDISLGRSLNPPANFKIACNLHYKQSFPRRAVFCFFFPPFSLFASSLKASLAHVSIRGPKMQFASSPSSIWRQRHPRKMEVQWV